VSRAAAQSVDLSHMFYVLDGTYGIICTTLSIAPLTERSGIGEVRCFSHA